MFDGYLNFVTKQSIEIEDDCPKMLATFDFLKYYFK